MSYNSPIEVYNLWLLVYLELCRHHQSILEHFHHLKKKPCAQLSSPPDHPLAPGSQESALCLCRSVHRGHFMELEPCAVWLLSLPVPFSRSIHVKAWLQATWVLRLGNIPACGRTTFSLSSRPVMDLWVVSRSTAVWRFLYRFVCQVVFYSFHSWVSSQEWNYWVRLDLST